MHRIGYSHSCQGDGRALRWYYDEVGLLKPAPGGPGHRLPAPTTAQLVPFSASSPLRQAGLSIEEVAVLSGQDGRRHLERRREEMRWKSRRPGAVSPAWNLFYARRIFSWSIRSLSGDIPSCIVFCKGGVIPSYASLSEFWSRPARSAPPPIPPQMRAARLQLRLLRGPRGTGRRTWGLMYAQAVTSVGRETDAIKFKTCPPSRRCASTTGQL